MTVAGRQGPAPTPMFPSQLPMTNEDDFNEAESLLKNESVCSLLKDGKLFDRLNCIHLSNMDNISGVLRTFPRGENLCLVIALELLEV